jgi:predicted nucleotidyltransferase
MIHHITQGRMNPVHAGHELVINQVRNAAGKNGHTIILTGSHDPKKNPLTPEQKLKHAKRAFPGANIITATKEHPTLLHQLSRLHSNGVTDLHMHVGSDRVDEFKTLLNKYNGVEGRHGYFKFNNIKIHTVGEERSDENHGVSGASASKMRAAAAAGDQTSFHSMAPSGMSEQHKAEMYDDVRRGMGIKESFSFKKFIGR